MLRGGLLAAAGVTTVGATSVVFTGTAQAATANPQTGWGYCHYCSVMFWVAGKANSVCPGNGTHGEGSGSYNYALYNSYTGLNNNSQPQPNWRWCHLCQGLFWGGDGGVCGGNNAAIGAPGIGPHAVGVTSYDLYWNLGGGSTSNPQPYWRWCQQCSLLFWAGPSGNDAGLCPISYQIGSLLEHAAGSSTSYEMYHYSHY